VHKWRVHFDPRLGTKQHDVAAGFGHALLSAVAVNAFEALHVSASIWEHGSEWLPLHTEPNIIGIEVQHSKRAERFAHNERCFDQVLREKRTVLARHVGNLDLFVPILAGGDVVAILVTGPFADERPTAASLSQQWRLLAGRHPHPSDPGFAAFVDAALSILVLAPAKLREFTEMVECLAQLMAGSGSAERILNRAEVLRTSVEEARFTDRTWSAVHEMLDERSSQIWDDSRKDLSYLGLPGMPEDILVGLTASRDPQADPIDEIVRRDALQRAAVELARKTGNTIAGRVGDHGVVFLCPGRGSLQSRRQRLRGLADRAWSLADRRFGLRSYFGASGIVGAEPLSRSFQAALSAAEAAVAAESRLVIASADAPHPVQSHRRLRRELGALSEDHPNQLAARFDRYIEAVTAESGHRIEALRGHLDAGFDAVSLPLLRSGTLDEKSFSSLCEVLDRASREARTSSESLSAYRRAIADVVDAVRRPVVARRARGIRHAVEYIEQHYGEALSLAAVARAAGMANARFSRLFKSSEGIPFDEYVRGRRMDRAKHLLSSTGLPVARIAEMSGWGSVQYFCRAFRKATGKTPGSYRRLGAVQKKVIKVQNGRRVSR